VLAGLDSENVVAFADVDWVRAADGFKLWEKATKYNDYRRMLEKEKSVDTVTVVIPDHERRMPEARRGTKPVHVPPRRRRDQMGVRCAREHAARHGVLVGHR
jgi:hypothetical protein